MDNHIKIDKKKKSFNNNDKIVQMQQQQVVNKHFYVKNYDQSTLAQWLKESVVKYVIKNLINMLA